jgi:rhodanese-related sulfurtransferase
MTTPEGLFTNMILARINKSLRESLIITTVTLVIAILFNLLRPAGIPLFDFSSVNLIKEQQAKIPTTTLTEAYDLYLKKKVVFIDARDPLSFEEGHIAGALNIYPDEAVRHAANLKIKYDQGFAIITYCDGPQCPLSKETAHALLMRGIPNVKILVNGWGIWLKAGYPISKGKK